MTSTLEPSHSSIGASGCARRRGRRLLGEQEAEIDTVAGGVADEGFSLRGIILGVAGVVVEVVVNNGV